MQQRLLLITVVTTSFIAGLIGLRADDRAQYLHALDCASIDLDLHPFASFIAKQMQASLKKA
jgi:hypothetical protein